MIFDTISKTEISLVTRLSEFKYPGLALDTQVDDYEVAELTKIREKFKSIAGVIDEAFGLNFGPFRIKGSTGNPVNKGGRLRRIWSCVYKGNVNKQYAAQIIIGIDPITESIDIGFSFGLASSRVDDQEKKADLIEGLVTLGQILHSSIYEDQGVLILLNDLLDMGFKCYVKGQTVHLDYWISNLLVDPAHSSITVRLRPETDGLINPDLMQYYLKACISLMSIFPYHAKPGRKGNKFLPRTKTSEERAREAINKTLIGIKGEFFVLDYERKKLARLKLVDKRYPEHKASESDAYHYDILSKDQYSQIHIEVKTTARSFKEPGSEVFYMSAAEYQFYKDHPKTYRLYRVYDIHVRPR